jgi:hypothetical protein
MHLVRLSAALFVAALALPSIGHAQSGLSAHSRGRALALNALAGAGSVGGRARAHLEYQQHFGPAYHEHMVGVGLAFAGGGAPFLGVTGRYQYDFKPIDGVAFFLSPYGGLEVGIAFAPCGGGSGPALTDTCAGFGLAPVAGLDLKLIVVDRLLLGLRPVGLVFPIGFGGLASASWGFEGGVTIGLTL